MPTTDRKKIVPPLLFIVVFLSLFYLFFQIKLIQGQPSSREISTMPDRESFTQKLAPETQNEKQEDPKIAPLGDVVPLNAEWAPPLAYKGKVTLKSVEGSSVTLELLQGTPQKTLSTIVGSDVSIEALSMKPEGQYKEEYANFNKAMAEYQNAPEGKTPPVPPSKNTTRIVAMNELKAGDIIEIEAAQDMENPEGIQITKIRLGGTAADEKRNPIVRSLTAEDLKKFQSKISEKLVDTKGPGE
jgi:hypothetical protein